MTEKQEHAPQSSPTPEPERVPETLYLKPESRKALAEIQKRFDNKEQVSAEDVVANAIDVFNVLTHHLSQKDSTVMLYTLGESPKTLHIPHVGGHKRAAKRTVMPPKMTW